MTPIFQTSTYAQSGVGQHLGYDYSRTANPTRSALEKCLAALEGATHGLAFASGMAAVDALLRQLRPGDHLLIPDDAYGGTYRLVSKVHAPAGLGLPTSGHPRPRGPGGGVHPEHPHGVGGNALPTRSCGSSTSPPWLS